jgi:uncharacterized membrane protein YfhO
MNYQVLALYAFCRPALGDGVSDISSYSQKSNVTSSSARSQSSQAQMGEELCYAVYDDVGNNLYIRSLLKLKFYLTDDLRINEINAI